MQKEKGRKVFVVGVGMTKFEKPGRREDFDYPQMAKESAESALRDAGLSYSAIEQAVVGYVYGDSTCGQRAVYLLGMTGIPIYNVSSNPTHTYTLSLLLLLSLSPPSPFISTDRSTMPAPRGPQHCYWPNSWWREDQPTV
jgi:hypothetical protein